MNKDTRHKIPADAAVAVGRFLPNGPVGYRSSHSLDAPLRETRVEAVLDWLRARNRGEL